IYSVIPIVSFSSSFPIKMPLDSSKPPDPILQEFSTLTGMSSEGIHHKPFVPADDSRPPRKHGRHRGVKNHFKGVKIKVQSPGSASAGAGAILKKLRNSKMVGKRNSCSDSSPSDVISGKRANSNPCPVDDVLVMVLDKIAYDMNVSDQMVFKEGVIDYGMGSSKISSMENKGDCVTDSVDPCLVSNGASKLNMDDGEHVGVESTKKASKDEGSGVKGDSGFVFGNVQSNKV
ncbi:hypothetical protein Tco_0847050, partial [Tanacetum coccineum]